MVVVTQKGEIKEEKGIDIDSEASPPVVIKEIAKKI
jgi:hypothetical protein